MTVEWLFTPHDDGSTWVSVTDSAEQVLYYNVDGKHDLGVPEPTVEYDDGLTREERVELLTHRCFITTAKQHDDRYPYEDRLRSEA
ncbi:hypothetical protein [Sorangium sp. So ce388]|uniref:hypothetical protein n=1 Tax=Sorangium sp. So ce388 TaxID=3133309 RepID=UPI003F5AFD9E